MVKIEANTDRSFLINGIPYQKGQYEISPLSDETQIKIVRVGSDTVVTKAPLTDWVDAGDSPFADFAAFVLYTEPFFFRSVAGGGGGSVNSVTGDGVGGTATDVLLTFPTSNQVDNDSLIPGANVTLALNELGVATSDNATAISQLSAPLSVNNPTTPYVPIAGDVVLWDTTTGNKVVDLPLASANLNMKINVKKTDPTINTITINPNGIDTIDGGVNIVLTTQYETVTLISNGVNWFIL